MAAAGVLAKHEQILVLDPPTDLKFKGRVIEKSRGRAEGEKAEKANRMPLCQILPARKSPRMGERSVG